MENNLLIRNLVIKKITEKYFTYLHPENYKWRNKQFIKIETLVSNFDFKDFTDKGIGLSSRTASKFYKGEDVSSHTFSVFVILGYIDNAAFIALLKTKDSLSLEIVYETFGEFISNNRLTHEASNTPQDNQNELALAQFKDPLLLIYKYLKGNALYIFIFYWLLYHISVISLALITGVWEGIDYPLSKSFSVCIGYFFYAFSATQFTLFNVEYKHLMGLSYPQKKKIVAKNSKYFTLLLAIGISIVLHYSFLKDNLHGWCEKEPGTISALGIYHALLYTFNLWISFNFIYYYTCFNKIVQALNISNYTSKIELMSFIKKILKPLSKLDIIYKNIIISYGGFSILFLISFLNFQTVHQIVDLYLWQIFEIAILIILYILFGFILYWKFFTATISNFLAGAKEALLSPEPIHIETNNFALSLASSPSEINKFQSNIRNVVIWLITLIIAILLALICYLQYT